MIRTALPAYPDTDFEVDTSSVPDSEGGVRHLRESITVGAPGREFVLGLRSQRSEAGLSGRSDAEAPLEASSRLDDKYSRCIKGESAGSWPSISHDRVTDVPESGGDLR